MKNSQIFRISGAYTSPGTPEYGDTNVGGTPKSWHSERVPLPANSIRRHIGAAALMPFNSGRTLPSKWDDAERWITSPISGYSAYKSSTVQSPGRPKAKSGPQDLVYLSDYSPTAPALEEGGNARNFMANSPLTTGVLVPDGYRIHYDAGQSLSWSTSIPGLSDLLSEASVPSSQDYKIEGSKEENEAMVSRVVSRRDMATQMSPGGSSHSERLSFSGIHSAITTLTIADNNSTTKDEIRDVQVDKTMIAKQPKKQKMKVNEFPLPWNVAAASRNVSRKQREEAKIIAWENLQKAKAEAAIQKLEMSLEKKRSNSMDKILNKLRVAQMKAQSMRNKPLQASQTRKYKCSFSHCFVFN